MPTVEQNLNVWGTEYDWSRGGDEWSASWGGTEALWWGTVFPRIRRFVPTNTILEIGPGFGRCTQYLQGLCKHMVVVDLSQRCIDACRKRFSGASHIAYHVNDGQSLETIPEGSVDFAFSYDSLVHADADVIRIYLSQLASKMSPRGVGFVHHSNIGAYLLPLKQCLPAKAVKRVYLPISRRLNHHWRAEDMTADRFDRFCSEAGLRCISQEVISWGGKLLNDCFSVFTREGSAWVRPRKVVVNRQFMFEARRMSRLEGLYGATGGERA